MLIDSHYSMILLEEKLYPKVQELKSSIALYREICTLMEKSLRGYLGIFHKERIQRDKKIADDLQDAKDRERDGKKYKNKKQPKKERVYLQRWDKMVSELNDGLGAYAIQNVII